MPTAVVPNPLAVAVVRPDPPVSVGLNCQASAVDPRDDGVVLLEVLAANTADVPVTAPAVLIPFTPDVSYRPVLPLLKVTVDV